MIKKILSYILIFDFLIISIISFSIFFFMQDESFIFSMFVSLAIGALTWQTTGFLVNLFDSKKSDD